MSHSGRYPTIDPRTPPPTRRFDVAVATGAAALGTVASVAFLSTRWAVPSRSFGVVLFTLAPAFGAVALLGLGLRTKPEDLFARWVTAGLGIGVVALVLQLVSFGSVAPGGGVFGTSTNNNGALYLLFHAAYPLGALAGALRLSPRGLRPVWALGLVGAFAIAADAVEFPALVAEGSLRFTPAVKEAELGLIGLTLAAFVVSIRKLGRTPEAMHGWLVLSLPLATYDLALNALTGRRFDPLWWSSLTLRVMTFAVLAVGVVHTLVRQLARWEQYTADELDRRESQLRQARLWEAMLDVADDVIAVLDSDGRLVSLSRSAQRLFGPRADRAPGAVPADLGLPPGPEAVRRLEGADDGRARFRDWFTHDDGTTVAIEGSGTRVGDRQVWVLRDITERFQLEATERQLQEATAASKLLQDHLLPGGLVAVEGISVAARYVSAGHHEEVGGDWYDTIPLATDAIALIIGDVEGHDLSAAALMGQLRAAVRSFALENFPPAVILERTNEFLLSLDVDRLATMIYAQVYPNERLMTIASAGHHPALLVTHPGGDVVPVDVPEGGLPLGVHTGARWRERTVRLDPGASLVFYTDGLVEGSGRDIATGVREVATVASGAAGDGIEAMADAILGVSPAFDDDVAVLVARLSPTPRPPRLRRRFPLQAITPTIARLWLLDLYRIWIDDGTITPDDRTDEAIANAALVLTELVSNALRHAELTIDVACAVEGTTLRAEIYDTSHRMPHHVPAAEGSTSGRGLEVVDALATAWGVEVLEESLKYVWFEVDLAGAEERADASIAFDLDSIPPL